MSKYQAGKLYIHRLNETLVISPDELQSYLNSGWKLGRKDSSRCYVHKDQVYKNINVVFLADYLSKGWIYGAAGKPRTKKRN